jgi:integrase
MRPSELWKCTINQENDIYYFDLTSKDIDLKTSTSRRKIPLHSKLIDMNIHNRLRLLQDNFKQVNISNHFNKQIINTIEDTNNKRMYGFRHTVATTLKHNDIFMDKVSEILGHSYQDDSMTKSTYSANYTLLQLKEAIDSLNY